MEQWIEERKPRDRACVRARVCACVCAYREEVAENVCIYTTDKVILLLQPDYHADVLLLAVLTTSSAHGALGALRPSLSLSLSLGLHCDLLLPSLLPAHVSIMAGHTQSTYRRLVLTGIASVRALVSVNVVLVIECCSSNSTEEQE